MRYFCVADSKIDDMADTKVDDTFLTRLSVYEEKKKLKKDKIELMSLAISDLQRTVMMMEEEQKDMKRSMAEMLYLLKNMNNKESQVTEQRLDHDPWSIVI